MKEEYDSLKECSKTCIECKESCAATECRHWIDYSDEYNCSLISIYENGPMTLDKISKRLDLSLVRISQIEKQALGKLLKRIKI